MSNIGIGTYVEDQHEQTMDPFELFTSPNVITDLIHGKTLTIFPQGPVTDTGPYDFVIPADPSEFTLMPFTRLEGELEIIKTAVNFSSSRTHSKWHTSLRLINT
jgi:hypothetical protein